jgi:membrane protein
MTLITRLSRVRLLRRLGVVAAFQEGGLLEQVAPYALICLAFMLVYRFIPNTRVRPLAAVVGGLCGGVLWAATGAAFASYAVEATNTIGIYATFAVFILALVWLYLCWLTLLIGAQLAFYVQHPASLRRGYGPLAAGTAEQEETALGIMFAVGAAFQGGGGATRLADLLDATGLPGLALAPVIAQLESAGLLLRAGEDRLLPARDPARILLRDILAAVRDPHGSDVRAAAPWPDVLRALRGQLDGALSGALGQRTLADLVREAQPSA